jgi:dCTP deaminase
MSDKWIRSKAVSRTQIAWLRHGKFHCWYDSPQGAVWAMYSAQQQKDLGLSRKEYEYEPIISPFSDKQVTHVEYKAVGDDDGERSTRKIIPYGLSSYGYDIRVGNKFKVFTNINNSCVDPKDFNEDNFVEKFVPDGEALYLPPNSFALANTPEWFHIPRNILVLCIGKSTYARCGLIVNVTPLEPDWKGSLTLEFSNTTTLPAKIYAGEGCAQILFLEGNEECETSYAERGGKYMNQSAIPTLPRMLG